MGTLSRPPLITLGWSSWSVLVVVLTILMLTLLVP